MKRLVLFSTWLIATVAVSWVTHQVLDAADSEVRDAPQIAVVVATSVERPNVTAEAVDQSPEPTTSITPPTSSPSPFDESSTTVALFTQQSQLDGQAGATGVTAAAPAPGLDDDASPTTTTTQAATPTTTTGTSVPATTSTTAAEAWKTTTITSPGGNLTVSYRTGEVRYEVAVPAPGFELEIESTGPDVKVTFDGDDDDWEIRARWNNGSFSPEVKEG